MEARAGSRITVRSNTVGAPDRHGTVVEARSSGALLVRWDDDRETVCFPGSDARIEDPHASESAAGSDDVELLGGHIDMRITETDDSCEAVATLMTQRGSFQATGVSRRNPDDPHVPMIGEELAIARALSSLADQLEAEAIDAIDHHEVTAGHLI